MPTLIRRLLRAQPGEERAVGFAFAYFFMLLSSYSLLRPLREAMASGAVDSLFWFYVGTFTVMLLLTPLFGALVSRVSKPLLLPIAYGFFASNLLVFYVLFKVMPESRGLAAEGRHGRFELAPGDAAARIGGGMFAGLRIVAKSRYLFGVFAIIALGSIAAAFMYNELLRLVAAEYPDLESRAQYFGRLDFLVNLAAWVFQGFVVGWLIRRFELSGALVTMPIAALASFIVLAASPVLLVLAAGQILRRGGEYGIAKPSREVLVTVVNAETNGSRGLHFARARQGLRSHASRHFLSAARSNRRLPGGAHGLV